MNKWLFLLLIPSLAFAKWPASANMRKDPIYVEVESQKVVIYPEKMEIPATSLDIPRNEFEKFLDQVEQVNTVRYIVLILRPGSVQPHHRLRQLIQGRGVDVGFEPVETGLDFMDINKNTAYYLSAPSYTSPEMATRLVEYYSSKRRPFEIEVRSNALTILTNQVVVTREELQIAGNPFEQYLDQYRAKRSQGPYHYYRETGSDEFFAEVLKYSYEHGKRKGVWDEALPCTPIEVPATGRAPVYLECRDNQLFAVAANAPARKFEISNLQSFDPDTQFVCLLVRPDSFDIFRKARKAAWEHGLDVSCELQDAASPFAIGPEGNPLFP